MRSLIPPEVLGALSLAERHRHLATAWDCSYLPTGEYRAERRRRVCRHQAKAQKLRRRAEVLMERRAGNG